MWRATKGDWKFFKGYTYFWEFFFRHIVWVNERLLELIFGVEGRYKLQMRHFLQLNDFGIEIPGRGASRLIIRFTADDPTPIRTRAGACSEATAVPMAQTLDRGSQWSTKAEHAQN